ncbi:MAG: M48 family metalloprotease [Acidimicrobiales bacterium]
MSPGTTRRPASQRSGPTLMLLNTAKTTALLAGLGGLLVMMGSFIGGSFGLIIGLLFGLALVGSTYWFADRLAVRAARARPLGPNELPWLQEDLHLLSQRADIAPPRLFLSPDSQPNAFASGRNEKKAIVCVTEGLLQRLDRAEVRAVLAHEIAHVRHRDILIGSVAAAVATAISAVANLAMFAGLFGGGSEDEDHPNPLALLALAFVAPVAASLIQLALSRSREFEADRLGAQLIGSPVPLASALRKLDAMARRQPMQINPAQASAYIVNPLTGRKVAFSRLFLTHPPVEDRIRALLGSTSGSVAASAAEPAGLVLR